MNETLQNFAKTKIKEGLSKCNDNQVNLFIRMYGHNKPNKSLSEIVDEIPEDKLDWAMQQVERTIKNKN